jgi:hypothetical protein
MSNTIELLETIGRDASLRHASSEELTDLLQQSQASVALMAAVAAGDSSLLADELGHKANYQPQSIQTTPGHEEEEEEPKQDDTDKPDASALAGGHESPAAESTR